ncbi:YggW family oxidoreductase [Thiohalocapsa halophila]|uniref:Heme chaperone HemW n=1 Tax=Thiohalocapsa halophila TaxID=69359 RepID=A0ABS1CM85_9GAMM|nr:YggW family oxidoreductase [Thiohalocapsa halophila]
MECHLGADLSAGAGSGVSGTGAHAAAVGQRRLTAGAPPLALYVHLPWCPRKCPYCDFNSHRASEPLPEDAYVDALLADLDAQLGAPAACRGLISIFIGGGTPSLFSGAAVARLLAGIRSRCALAPDAEITLEANPGTVDAGHFRAYRAAGVNRLSIGVQSLSAAHLDALGRIHDPEQARAAVAAARAAGFENINLDMMFGLPRQTPAEARADLDALIALAPEHISYYQLTLEPNTAFAHRPPPVPDHDSLDAMAEAGAARLAAAGYGRYEVSAYARDGYRCRHNLNYWRFGDYLGIGAGAHGKLTDVATGAVVRRSNKRSPADYLARPSKPATRCDLSDADLVLELAMNALRLVDGVESALFAARTGLPPSRLASARARLTAAGLLEPAPERLAATPLGQRFLNDLVAGFAEE